MSNPIKKDKVKRNEPSYNWLEKRHVRAPYEPYNDPGVDCSEDPGVTDGSQAAELDVNQIIRRAQKSGILPGTDVERVYADVSDAVSYHEALNLINNAHHQFMSLEAEVRARFENDPAKFTEFMHDEKNVEEMYKLGLAERPKDDDRRPGAPSPAAPASSPGVADSGAAQPKA